MHNVDLPDVGENVEGSILRLIDAMPKFATVDTVTAQGAVIFNISLPIDAGATDQFRMKVTSTSDGVCIQDAGGRLPQPGCPERHINFDGSLCLGIAPTGTKVVVNDNDAQEWWVNVESHLQGQVIAEVTGKWRPSRELSHGDGAIYQLQAEKLAESIGILETYLSGLHYSIGPFGLILPRIHPANGMLVNQRAVCPCMRSIKRGERHLRRNCPDKSTVAKLVAAEWKRRKAVDKFIQDAKAKGYPCCNTMKNCPLRD